MSYKPDHQELMAYLYDELEGADKAKVEQYLLENPDERIALEKLAGVSAMLGTVKDKEVIAPPIFIPEDKAAARLWDAPYFRTIVSIAASLVLVILVARIAGTRVTLTDNEMRLSFGEPVTAPSTVINELESITPDQVQRMINESLRENNSLLATNWEDSQRKLEQSIRGNLVINSEKMDQIVKEASSASREQVQEFVSGLQTENMKMVKDYFTLSSTEQKQYIEGLLVDFAKYLQQQRKDDMQLVQMRLNSIEQNSTVFQQETEQILTSIITSVGAPAPKETKY